MQSTCLAQAQECSSGTQDMEAGDGAVVGKARKRRAEVDSGQRKAPHSQCTKHPQGRNNSVLETQEAGVGGKR